jgi:hypothetical protein
MGFERTPNPKRLRRLVEELGEIGLILDGSQGWHGLAIDEIDYAMRPDVHERRVPSAGAIIEPTTDPATWSKSTALEIDRRATAEQAVDSARHYADGVSSWLIRRVDGHDEWIVFDRSAGSERDLVVLADAFGAAIVQRHPSNVVRVVGAFGVFRWDGLTWQHQPLVSAWIDTVGACALYGDREVLQRMLEFAVHDLGARGIGTTLVYRADDQRAPYRQERLPVPPPLSIVRSTDLAPLRHVLAQIDGANLFDESGTLTEIGVRLVSSQAAEREAAGFRGMRHTSGRRYSFDDPTATVIVVSDDGPVTVFRAGNILGASAPTID